MKITIVEGGNIGTQFAVHSSRYFTADFPYGLTVIKQIGDIADASTPNIDMLLEWYDGIAIINDKLMLADNGITDIESLRRFYLRQDFYTGCRKAVFFSLFSD